MLLHICLITRAEYEEMLHDIFVIQLLIILPTSISETFEKN